MTPTEREMDHADGFLGEFEEVADTDRELAGLIVQRAQVHATMAVALAVQELTSAVQSAAYNS